MLHANKINLKEQYTKRIKSLQLCTNF